MQTLKTMLTLITVSLLGCATPRVLAFEKDGVSPDQLRQDHAACELERLKSERTDWRAARSIVNLCMIAKGYELVWEQPTQESENAP